MRGFIISLVALLFLVFLFFISTSLHSHYLAIERALLYPQPLSYGAFAISQAAYALNAILGPDIWMSSSNSSFTLVIRQDVPAENRSRLLSDYEELLEQELANKSHASIEADLTDLSDGAYEMDIAGLYRFSNSQEGRMAFRGLSGSTGAYSYELNITVPKERRTLTPTGAASPTGMNATIRYMDLNGSYVERATLDPAVANRFIVEYTDNSTLTITIGRESGDDGSLVVDAANASAQVSWSVVLPPLDSSHRPGYAYDAWMSYSSGPYSVSRRIGT